MYMSWRLSDPKYMCDKTFVNILTADNYNDTFIKTEIDSLIPNIDLSNYYIETEIGSLFQI